MSGSGDLNVALTLKAQTEGKELVDALGTSLDKLGEGAPQQLNEVGQALDTLDGHAAEGKAEIDSLGSSLNKVGDGAPEQLNEVGQALDALDSRAAEGKTQVDALGKELQNLGDGASDGLKTVEQEINTLGNKAATGKEQVGSLEQSLGTLGSSAAPAVAAVGQQLGNVGIKASTASEAIRNAFSVVGVRSAEQIQTEIHEIDIALQKLGMDATVSGQDLARAFASGQAKIVALETELKGVSAATREASASADAYSFSLGGALKSVIAWATAAVGLSTVVDMGKKVLETGSAFEVLGARLTQMLGSSYQAKQALQDIKDLAASTPFEVKDLSDAFVQLTTFGMHPTRQMMVSLTDTVASLGGGTETLQRVTLALGQAWVKTKLQGDEIMQLTEAGIPVWDALAKATGKSTAELAKMSEEGQLGRDVISKLIATLGTMNLGASAAQMNTFTGTVSNAKDAMTEFWAEIADSGVLTYLKVQLQSVLAEFDRMKQSGELQQKAKEISDAFVGMASAGKTVITTIKDYAGVIKLALEVMVVNKVLSFGSALVSQANAALTAATATRTLNSQMGAVGPAAAAASEGTAIATAGLGAVSIGARAATAAMIGLRVAMRAVGIGLLIEGISLLLDKLVPARVATDDLAVSTAELAQSTKDAAAGLKAEADAHDLLNNKFERTTYQADRLGKIMTEAKSAATALGVGVENFGNIASESFIKAQNELAKLIQGMPILRQQGVDTARMVSEAINKMISTAKNQKEIDMLIARLEALGKTGDIAAKQLKEGLEEAKKKSDELKDGISSVDEAFKQLGMKTRQELQDTADKAKEAYDFIRDSGTATPKEIAEAFEAYAKRAIDANGGVVSSAIKVEGAMHGVEVQVDATGKKFAGFKDNFGNGGSGGKGNGGGGGGGGSSNGGGKDKEDSQLPHGGAIETDSVNSAAGSFDYKEGSGSNVGSYGELSPNWEREAITRGMSGDQIPAFVAYAKSRADELIQKAYAGSPVLGDVGPDKAGHTAFVLALNEAAEQIPKTVLGRDDHRMNLSRKKTTSTDTSDSSSDTSSSTGSSSSSGSTSHTVNVNFDGVTTTINTASAGDASSLADLFTKLEAAFKTSSTK